MDQSDLQMLVDQLSSSVAKHDQARSMREDQERLLQELIADPNALNSDRPILVELLKTLAIFDAAERMQAEAVTRLRAFVAERRDARSPGLTAQRSCRGVVLGR